MIQQSCVFLLLLGLLRHDGVRAQENLFEHCTLMMDFNGYGNYRSADQTLPEKITAEDARKVFEIYNLVAVDHHFQPLDMTDLNRDFTVVQDQCEDSSNRIAALQLASERADFDHPNLGRWNAHNYLRCPGSGSSCNADGRALAEEDFGSVIEGRRLDDFCYGCVGSSTCSGGCLAVAFWCDPCRRRTLRTKRELTLTSEQIRQKELDMEKSLQDYCKSKADDGEISDCIVCSTANVELTC